MDFDDERVVWVETSPTNGTITTNLSSSVYLSMEFFDAIFIPTIVVFGLIGNILSVFVFSTTKLSRLPSSSYLTALAVSDSISLINLLLVSIPGPKSPIHLPVLCNLIVYLINVCGMTSSWLVVVFTVERFVVIQYPLHKLAKCSSGKARRLIFLVVPFPCLWYVYTFLIAGIDPASQRCTVLLQYQVESTVLHTIDILIVYLMPALVVTLLNLKISRKLVKCRRQRSTMQQGGSSPTNQEPTQKMVRARLIKRSTMSSLRKFRFPSQHSSAVATTLNENSALMTPRNSNATVAVTGRSNNDLAITRTLIVTSTAFAVFHFPHNFIQMVRSIVPLFGELLVGDVFHVFTVLSSDLYYLNFAINVIVYHMTSSNYRNGAKRVLRPFIHSECCKRNAHKTWRHRNNVRAVALPNEPNNLIIVNQQNDAGDISF